jgi:hypothetical protein
VVVLQIEVTATIDAITAIALEDSTPDLARDGLSLVAWALLPSFLDVQEGASAIQVLGGPSLPAGSS